MFNSIMYVQTMPCQPIWCSLTFQVRYRRLVSGHFRVFVVLNEQNQDSIQSYGDTIIHPGRGEGSRDHPDFVFRLINSPSRLQR